MSQGRLDLWDRPFIIPTRAVSVRRAVPKFNAFHAAARVHGVTLSQTHSVSWPNSGRREPRSPAAAVGSPALPSAASHAQFHRTPVKTKQNRTVCSPALQGVGAAGVAVRRLRRLLTRCFVHVVSGRVSVCSDAYVPICAVDWRRCFDASFARNDGDERPWFLSYSYSTSLSLSQLQLLAAQLLLVLGAAGCSARRQMEAPNAYYSFTLAE